MNAEPSLDGFESAFQLFLPAVEEEVPVAETAGQIDAQVRLDDRQVETPAVVGEEDLHFRKKVEERLPPDPRRDQLRGPLAAPVNPYDGDRFLPGGFNI